MTKMEKSNMSQNTQSNQKHTWTKSAAIVPLPPSCAFLPLIIPKKIFSKNPLLFLSLSRIYISLSKRDPPNLLEKKIPSFLPFLNLLSFLIFFPFYNRFPHRNNIRAILLKTKSPFFQNSIDSPSK